MGAPRISLYWQGPLSLYEHGCMASFVAQGFDVDLYSYAALEPPAGVTLRDAGELLDKGLSTAYTQGGMRGNPTAFSDRFRYQLLAERGGLWVDSDIFCLRPASDYAPLLAAAGERVLLARERKDSVNCAVMASRPGNALVRDLIAAAEAQGFELTVWGAIGPRLVSEFARQRPAEVALLALESFYPVDVQDFALPLLPESRERCEALCRESYGLHLWNNLYAKFCIPKNMLPPEGSFLHARLHKLLGEHPALPAETLRRLIKGSEAIDSLKGLKRRLAEQMTQLLKEI